MHEHFSIESPGYCEVIRALRAWPYDVVSINCCFHHLYSCLNGNIFEFVVINFSLLFSICFVLVVSFLFSFFVFNILQNWSIFSSKVKSILIEIDGWMELFYDPRETEFHAVVSTKFTLL